MWFRTDTAANAISNRAGRGTTPFSDGELHRRQRRILKAQLGPAALSEARPRIEALAEHVLRSRPDSRLYAPALDAQREP